MDERLISDPVVQAVISGGQAVIEGNFTAETANDLAPVSYTHLSGDPGRKLRERAGRLVRRADGTAGQPPDIGHQP